LQNSGYAYNEGGINPYIKGPNGESYTIFDKFGVEYRSLKPAAVGKESVFADITKAAGIPNDGTLEQNIIDTARGAKSGTFAAIIADLNAKWGAAVKANQ
jgi:hypothetical protein